MARFISGIELSARFILPALFAAWFFRSGVLPLPWPLGAVAVLGALVWYVLFIEANACLEQFERSRSHEQTPFNDIRPEVKLEGVLKVLALYLVVSAVMTAVAGASASYLRSHSVGPFAWAPVVNEFSEFLGGKPAGNEALPAGVIALVTGLLSYIVTRLALFPAVTPYRRGRAVGHVEAARKELLTHRESAEPEIMWGGLGLPWSAGPRHFLAAGMTGSGKTNLLLQFMASVLPWIGRKRDQRALLYDPKTELVSFLYGLGLEKGVRILHPFDSRGCAWNVASDVDDPTSAQQVASILIPEDKKTKNPYFSRAAGQLLAGVFTFLMKEAPGQWDLRDVIFIMEDEGTLREVLRRNPETASLVEEFFNPPETFANVRSEIAVWMRRYRPVAACWHHAAKNGKVSLKDWVTSEEIILLGQDEANRFQMEAINRAMFLRASQLLLKLDNSEDRRSWVIVDEVREMGSLEGLPRLLTNGRSKGACFSGGYQTPSGMKDAVGEHVADEINDQIWNIALCRMGADVSAEWASRMVGDVEFEEEQPSEGPGGKSKTTHVVKRRALLPEYFKELPPPTPKTGVSGVFITPYTGVYRHTVPGAEIAKVRKLRLPHVPDFVPRPKNEQELPPWTDDDYRRLGLTPLPPPSGQAQSPVNTSPTRLRVVKSGGTGT